MKFHLRRTKRVAALATALSTVALVVQLTTPAQAAVVTSPDAVQSIFPAHVEPSGTSGTDFSNSYSGSTQMGVLTNKAPVGAAHLTAVSADPGAEATNGATEMLWFYCDSTFIPVSPHCTAIGASTTPTIAPAAAGYVNTAAGDGTIDAAWDLNWNIPANLTGDVFDIVAVGCNGVPDPTLTNCTWDSVPDVLLDGGGGPFPQTSSGRIVSPQNGGVFTQEVATAVAGATSPEITAVAFGFDAAGSGDDDPAGDGSQVVDATGPYEGTLVTTSATATAWAVNVPANDVAVGEYALTFFGTNDAGLDSGIVSAPCDQFGPDCAGVTSGLAFDRNYVVAEAGIPGTPDHVDLGVSPDCTSTPKNISAPAGSTVDLTGCVLDPFNKGVADETVNWDLASSSTTQTGSFVGSPAFVTDADGNAASSVTAPASAAGSKTTITFCDDPDSTGSCVNPPNTNIATVPAQAFSIIWTTPGTHDRSVSLKLKDSLKAKGTVSVGDGFTACADTVPVKIQRRANGSWHTKKTTTTASDGTYHVKLKNKSGKYRAVAPATTAQGETCNKAVSPKRKYHR